MEIRNRTTGAVITDSQLRADNPGTSFPKQLTADILDGLGYDPVLNGAAATVSGPYEVSTRDGVEEINGQWFTKFIVGPVFADSDEETAYRTSIDNQAAANVRADRDRKLAACDWTVLTDSPLTTAKKTEWKTYRTALRDISAAEGFPHTMEWPTEPS
tara:strand:- start:6945 stop:7418 length:474 start_codon:yes stop_codon:yes gene_type:complete